MIDSSRKIQYNTSLNADAALIPTGDYDLVSKKYIDDALIGISTNTIKDSDNTTNIIVDELENITMNNNGSSSMVVTETLIDAKRKMKYDNTLNNDAGLIPIDDYDIVPKKYVDDIVI